MLNRFDDQKKEPYYLEWAISGDEILQYKLFEVICTPIFLKELLFGVNQPRFPVYFSESIKICEEIHIWIWFH